MASSLVSYAIVCSSLVSNVRLGVGFFFAGIMLVITGLQSKFSDFSPASSEEFTVYVTDIMCHILSNREYVSERFKECKGMHFLRF